MAAFKFAVPHHYVPAAAFPMSPTLDGDAPLALGTSAAGQWGFGFPPTAVPMPAEQRLWVPPTNQFGVHRLVPPTAWPEVFSRPAAEPLDIQIGRRSAPLSPQNRISYPSEPAMSIETREEQFAPATVKSSPEPLTAELDVTDGKAAPKSLRDPLLTLPRRDVLEEAVAPPTRPAAVRDALAAVSQQIVHAADVFNDAVAEIQIDDAYFGGNRHPSCTLEASRVLWTEKHNMYQRAGTQVGSPGKFSWSPHQGQAAFRPVLAAPGALQ